MAIIGGRERRRQWSPLSSFCWSPPRLANHSSSFRKKKEQRMRPRTNGGTQCTLHTAPHSLPSLMSAQLSPFSIHSFSRFFFPSRSRLESLPLAWLQWSLLGLGEKSIEREKMRKRKRPNEHWEGKKERERENQSDVLGGSGFTLLRKTMIEIGPVISARGGGQCSAQWSPPPRKWKGKKYKSMG